MIGSGLFVRTASAIAERAGPSVTIAYIIAGVGCVLAGLCYAEFASMIPIAGSAYPYSYDICDRGHSRGILFGRSRDAAGTITGVLHDEH